MSPEPAILVDARFKAAMRGGDRCKFELARCLVANPAGHYRFLGYASAAAALQLPPAAAVVCRYLPHQHPQADLYEHVTLPRLIEAGPYSLYHGTFQVLPLRKLAKPTVVTIHDMALFDMPEAYGRKFGYYMRFLLQRSILHADRIVTVSDATKRALLKYCPEAEPKIRTVWNGVSQAFRDAAAIASADAKDRLKPRLGPQPYVLFVGNLEPKKNLARLIEGFLRARRAKGFPHRLCIAGESLPAGPSSGLGAQALRDDAVCFLGAVTDSDLLLLYRGADLVAYPSLYEGFGMPVLEGLAAGIPVLTSNVSSLPEVAGGAAMLVDPLDPDAIAAGITAALFDVQWRTRAVHDGLVRAAALTWEACAQATERVYAELVR